jgi:hypothetical protein
MEIPLLAWLDVDRSDRRSITSMMAWAVSSCLGMLLDRFWGCNAELSESLWVNVDSTKPRKLLNRIWKLILSWILPLISILQDGTGFFVRDGISYNYRL